MLIVNGGLPRSGTVLVGNLVRLMLERRDIPWERYNPQERRDFPAFLDRVRQRDDGRAVIVHTHLIAPEIVAALGERPDAVLIWNHRDPRDALVSLIRLHDLPLEKALYAMSVYCAAAELALASPICLELRYGDLTADLPDMIPRIARALGFEPGPGEVAALVQQTSVDAHRKVMTGLSEGTVANLQEIQTRHRVLREDPVTLVNDRHIQSGASGRWQREMSAPAQDRVAAALAEWVVRFGYD